MAVESTRTNSKYSISVKQLIKLQQKNDEESSHNEKLAGNTKAATRGLFSPKDTLFDRLNLAFHANEIKGKYGIDVPLIVLRRNESPFNYNEPKIKADLIECVQRLQQGDFPFDTSRSPAFELDADGNIKTHKNKHIKQLDEFGEVVTIPKNMAYQQQLLVDLFKLGLPELSSIDEYNATPSVPATMRQN